MFSIFSKQEWGYASICFVTGLLILYNYSIHNSIPVIIMLPVDIIGAVCFYLFLRNIELDNIEKQSLEIVQQ